MHVDVYDRLAEALDRLPGRFAATPSHAERPLLRKLFSPTQARVAAEMGPETSAAAGLARSAGLPVAEVTAALAAMEEAGLVASEPADSGLADRGPSYRLESFVPGIFENQVGAMDEELARLFDAYMADGGAAAIMGAEPSIGRIVPTAAARSDWILPHDDARAIVEQAAGVALHDCVCRLQRDKLGERCRFPLHVCLALYDRPHPDDPDLISTERALAVLDEAEEAGLVHTVSNVAGRWDWICNCCSCCCEFLRGYAEWNVENAVVRNYRATIDADACTGCGVCAERCQVAAVTVEDDRASVDTGRCLGCGLCVTTCPADAVRLDRLPDAELVRPPADPEAWAEERQRDRGARDP